MSAAELLFGSRPANDFTSPRAQLGSDNTTLALVDVEIFYSLFELPMAAVLPRLPVSLHPSIPAVFATNFWHVPQSPFGEFHFAYIGVACRTGIKPRHLVHGAWCDNERAGEYLRSRYGLECLTAAIYLRETYDRVRGAVTIDGHTFLEVLCRETIPLVGAGGSVKYSPSLSLASVDAQTLLVQFEAAYEFKRVMRGPVRTGAFDAPATGEATLIPGYPIAGTFAVCDVELLPPRFTVDLAVPAESGGARKLRA
jgi:hypothetical protein